MGPHGDIFDITAPADQEPDLAVYFSRRFRELPGEFMRDNAVRRDTPPVNLLDPFVRFRSESIQISEDSLDKVPRNLLELFRTDLSLQIVQK
jgi:hypothetical protein